ncbi:glycosyltransferase family 2 protein [[Clostridium] aminophilum]|uniref:glycosyltransferase family 2 protein n=1 Tax=[Clostridium] aminophilum TaxID=1526 RepID=UPI0026F18403|nr:glycosyltransferase family 2 protein [[Clostridium] aminophilum]MDD6196744.1 glycosyltransferase family 2 protein [[Clostridium] aminophilum]
MENKTKLLSIVVSVYNEEAALEEFARTAVPIFEDLAWDYELIFVNDGSADRSPEILRRFAGENPKIKVINFSRNFGHEAAMIAGIDMAEGDGIICMDADLQHPPEAVREIIRRFDDGVEVITMVRTENRSAGLIKNVTSTAFYRLINHISDVKLMENASDFFAVTRKPADILRKNYREKVRFLRGYVQNIGFRREVLTYEAKPRVAGHSKYSIRCLFRFSINTILCFSDLPLRLGTYSGLFVGFLGLILMIYTIWSHVVSGTPNGYATIVVALCFMFAMLFFVVGIIGEYIAILFSELKDRPIYIVHDTMNMDEKEDS